MSKSFVHHICIQTNTYADSIKFYTEGLGFNLVQESPNFHSRDYNSWLQLGAFYIELQTGKKEEPLGEAVQSNKGIAHFCIWVENLDEEAARLQKLGAEFLLKNDQLIYRVENGSLCKVRAPEGTVVELRDNKGI